MDSSNHQDYMSLSVLLTPMEAKGLAHLCQILDWEFLAEHSRIAGQAEEARYALAKLRFALSDAGYLAMPDKAPNSD